jgi:hypothetical protein
MSDRNLTLVLSALCTLAIVSGLISAIFGA